MSLIYGVFNKTGQPVDPRWMPQMAQAIRCWPPDREVLHVHGPAAIGSLVRFNTPESRAPRPPRFERTRDVAVVFDGRLDNRDDLVARLELPKIHAHELRDDILVGCAWQRWGRDCCQYLLGDFALALWDEQRHELYLARDHLGVRPLFISETNHHIAFASNKKALLALPWVDRSLNEPWIADLLAINDLERLPTLYTHIVSFSPAHCVSYSRHRQSRCQRYWSLDPDAELVLDSDDEYTERFRALIEESVSCRLRSHRGIASELSGGLDSTTVTSLAHSILKQRSGIPVLACSHVLAPDHENVFFPYVDEKPWIADLCRFRGIEEHVAVTSSTLGMLDALQRNAEAHAGPNRADMSICSDELYRILSDNDCGVLLSGFGGDHLVTSMASGFFDEIGAGGDVGRLWKELRAANFALFGTSRACLKWFLRSRLPVIDRLWAWADHTRISQNRAWQEHSAVTFVDREFAERQGVPQRYRDRRCQATNGVVRHREFHMVCRAGLQFRIEDSTVGAEAAGIEYRYPLLDTRLLEFCLALPTRQKRRCGIKRRMIRMATEDLLPDSIRWRQDKTRATVPTVQQRLYRDRATICESLTEIHSALKNTTYVDWSRLLAFVQRIDKDQRTSREITKAFFRAYQLLYALAVGVDGLATTPRSCAMDKEPGRAEAA